MSTEEKFNQAAGAIKEGVGKLVGDKELESEGAQKKLFLKLKKLLKMQKML